MSNPMNPFMTGFLSGIAAALVSNSPAIGFMVAIITAILFIELGER